MPSLQYYNMFFCFPYTILYYLSYNVHFLKMEKKFLFLPVRCCLPHINHSVWQVQLLGCLFMGVVSILLFVERSPPLYHAYFAMTVFLWTQILGQHQFINVLWRYLSGRKFNYVIKLLATGVVSVFILELLVWS